MNEENNNETDLNVMKEKLSDLRKRIMTLEWDKSHNQLNSSMEAKYAQIKTECDALQKKVDGIKAELKEQDKGQEATDTAATATADTGAQAAGTQEIASEPVAKS